MFELPKRGYLQGAKHRKRRMSRASLPSHARPGLDGISIRILKLALPAISPSLEHIYNASISSGIVPDAFKKAKVTPIHKKESTHERGNFRPISVLPILSKPLKRHVSLALHEHLKTNKLLYINQSAYRANHSCETALLNITDKWLKEMDGSKLVATVFMDLSNSFDLVSHDVLRSKLAKYPVSPEALQWFTSYLSNRSQQCYMSGSLSSLLELKVGVPTRVHIRAYSFLHLYQQSATIT